MEFVIEDIVCVRPFQLSISYFRFHVIFRTIPFNTDSYYSVVVRALQGIELLAGPYERCVLRNRSKSRVVLISEHAKLPAAIAQFSFLLLQEEKCLGVYHTAFEFNDFCDMYPFTFETKSRRTSNCSDSMRPSLSLELDDMSVCEVYRQFQNELIIP